MRYNEITCQLHEFDSFNSQLYFFFVKTTIWTHHIIISSTSLTSLAETFSSNNFCGVSDIKMFSHLEHLDTLTLSHKGLSVREVPVYLYSLLNSTPWDCPLACRKSSYIAQEIHSTLDILMYQTTNSRGNNNFLNFWVNILSWSFPQ